jgi:hypothetical protein
LPRSAADRTDAEIDQMADVLAQTVGEVLAA